jgi:hypothetical protein
MPTIGFNINLRPQAASDNLLVAFKDFAVANISDAMSRTTGTYNLRPYHGGAKLCGRALTVRTRPGDNLMVHKAIDLAGPGDVIVVDAGGVCTNAIVGEIMTTLAARPESLSTVRSGIPTPSAAATFRCLPVAWPIVGLTRTDRAKSMSRSPSMAWWLTPATSS